MAKATHMKHYCVYTRDLVNCKGLFELFAQHDVQFEAHINRTRFWLDSTVAEHRHIWLCYSAYIHCIDHEINHATGATIHTQ